MAHKRARRRRGMGSVISVRRVSGLGRGLGSMMQWMGMLMLPLLGGAVSVGTTIAIQRWVNPARGQLQANLVRFASLVGTGAGLLVSLPVGMLAGGRGGAAGAATAVGAVVGGAAIGVSDAVRMAMLRAQAGQMAAAQPQGDAAAAGGTGVIVPEYRGLPARTGAIVFERERRLGKSGYEVSLGSVNTRVFGTPSF